MAHDLDPSDARVHEAWVTGGIGAEVVAAVAEHAPDALRAPVVRVGTARVPTPSGNVRPHALPNAAVPIVTIIGVGVALLLGGVAVTESVFAIPGLGRLVVDAILSRDYPVIQGVLLIFSATYVIINLIVDLLYVVIDPRIRYAR